MQYSQKQQLVVVVFLVTVINCNVKQQMEAELVKFGREKFKSWYESVNYSSIPSASETLLIDWIFYTVILPFICSILWQSFSIKLVNIYKDIYGSFRRKNELLTLFYLTMVTDNVQENDLELELSHKPEKKNYLVYTSNCFFQTQQIAEIILNYFFCKLRHACIRLACIV